MYAGDAIVPPLRSMKNTWFLRLRLSGNREDREALAFAPLHCFQPAAAGYLLSAESESFKERRSQRRRVKAWDLSGRWQVKPDDTSSIPRSIRPTRKSGRLLVHRSCTHRDGSPLIVASCNGELAPRETALRYRAKLADHRPSLRVCYRLPPTHTGCPKKKYADWICSRDNRTMGTESRDFAGFPFILFLRSRLHRRATEDSIQIWDSLTPADRRDAETRFREETA